jgi:hypothetical protein
MQICYTHKHIHKQHAIAWVFVVALWSTLVAMCARHDGQTKVVACGPTAVLESVMRKQNYKIFDWYILWWLFHEIIAFWSYCGSSEAE